MSKRLANLADLTPDTHNANRGTARGRGLLERSLRQYGAGRSILADQHGNIIAGNKTLEAAADLGLPIRVIETDGTELVVVQRSDLDLSTDKAARELAYADNRIAQLDLDWDTEALLADQQAGLDLTGVGFSDDELTLLLAGVDLGTEGLTDPDAVPAPPAVPITQPGDLWLLGRHRLLCGDSTALTDVARVGGASCTAIDFDPPYDADSAIVALRWTADDVLVFTDHRHTLDAVTGWPPFRNVFAWDGLSSWYVQGQPLARGKFCLWFGESDYDENGSHYGIVEGEARDVSNPRGTYRYHPDPRGKHLATIFASPATRQFDGHPHAKPVDWVRCLLANCTHGDIFSPFAGSGTSLIAAEQIERRWVGIEISPAYCDVIVQRWEAFTGGTATREVSA